MISVFCCRTIQVGLRGINEGRDITFGFLEACIIISILTLKVSVKLSIRIKRVDLVLLTNLIDGFAENRMVTSIIRFKREANIQDSFKE